MSYQCPVHHSVNSLVHFLQGADLESVLLSLKERVGAHASPCTSFWSTSLFKQATEAVRAADAAFKLPEQLSLVVLYLRTTDAILSPLSIDDARFA